MCDVVHVILIRYNLTGFLVAWERVEYPALLRDSYRG